MRESNHIPTSSGSRITRGVRLGPVEVALRTDEPGLLEYLADLCTITDEAVDEAARKAPREGLVEYCEKRRYVMLHASAFAEDHRVVLVVGRRGSGKTTLALKAALSHDCHYLSNDHAMIYLEPGSGPQSHRLAITSLLTPIPFKIGTYLDLEDSLPSPWEIIDLPERRGLSVAEVVCDGGVPAAGEFQRFSWGMRSNMREVGMFTVSGICVDSWVRVEGRCGITCDVVDDEAQFRFGGACSTGLQMIVTEDALEKIVYMSMDALRRMRAELGDHERVE